MTTETDVDMGNTTFDLLFAPGCYMFAQQPGHDAYWHDWCVEFSSDDGDLPVTLFTAGLERGWEVAE